MAAMIRAFVLAIALSLAASAQQEPAPAPELAPLVPPKAPWLKKNQQKKSRKKKAPPAAAQKEQAVPPLALPLPAPERPTPVPATPAAPPAQATSPAPSQLPLPPLVPLTPAPPLIKVASDLGVALDTAGLDPAAASRMAEGLRGVAKLSPATRNAPLLEKPAAGCADEACWAALGASQKVDQLLVATYADGALGVKLVDVAAKKSVNGAAQPDVKPEAATAVAESLACRLLVPAGCTGELKIDAEGPLLLELDGKPLPTGPVAVGVHTLAARAAGSSAERAVAVAREPGPTIYARVVDGAPKLLDAAPPPAVAAVAPKPPPAPSAAVAPAPAPAPSPQRAWTKPAGYAALGLGAVAAGVGAYFGAKSKSQLDQAESGFHANNGAYTASDASLLDSGNSKARNANALFIASGVLLAAGAVITFAF